MRIGIIGLWILASQLLSGQSIRDSLSAELDKIIENSEIPGLGVCVVGENNFLLSRGFGYRDSEYELNYDSLTVQSVASIAKTMIAVSLMKLVEDGKLNLDEDINSYLPFKVVNPRFPHSKITLLHLATHTSSILETNRTDNGSYYIFDRNTPKTIFPKGDYRYYRKYLKNEDLSMKDYLMNYLTLNGSKFKKNIYGKLLPGEQYQYSNIGSTLVAYIIETVSGLSFEDFSNENIFIPLGMKNTTWKQPNTENFASQYFHNGQKVPDYALITFPSSDLHTNSQDMGKFMIEMLNGRLGNGTILDSTSYETMFTNQINNTSIENSRGIFWNINPVGNIGHDGGEIGTACRLILSPSLKKAFFFVINMSVYDIKHLEKDFINILITLCKYTERLE